MDNQQAPGTPPTSSQQGKKDMLAVLSYLGILLLIPLLARKENAFCQYHAKQGLVLFIAAAIAMFVYWIPFIGLIIGFIVWIVWLIFAIMGIVNVVGGKQKPLPLIGGFAKKINI